MTLKKKNYSAPTLKVYGSIRELTKGGNGSKSESGRYAGVTKP